MVIYTIKCSVCGKGKAVAAGSESHRLVTEGWICSKCIEANRRAKARLAAMLDKLTTEEKAMSKEPMDYSGNNPMIALAVAEGWGGSAKFNDPDLRAALHQTTGIAFMHEYILRAYDEGVIEGLPKPLDAMSPREVMRLFKTAHDPYGLLRTKEDAPVPVNAAPRDNVVHMGKGEGEEFQMGGTTFKPQDAPQSAAPQDGSKVQGYRELSDANIEQMNNFKILGRAYVSEIDRLTREIKDRMNGPAMQSTEQREADGIALRWLAIARTHAQQATMAACRAVARPTDDC